MPRSETLLRIQFEDEILWSPRWNRLKKCRSCQTFMINLHDQPVLGGVSWAKGSWNRIVGRLSFCKRVSAYFQGRTLKHQGRIYFYTFFPPKSPEKLRGTGTNFVLLISRRMIWIPRLGFGSTIHIHTIHVCFPPRQTNMTNWNICVFSRKYIFIQGWFSNVMWIFRDVYVCHT